MMRLWLTCIILALSSQLPVVNPSPPPTQTFDEWLVALRADAIARGISQATVDSALKDLQPAPTVVQRDRTQAELVLTLGQYLDRRLTKGTIRTAQRLAREHRQLLRRVSAEYDVPSSIIVAVWGLESNFGRFSGVRPTIQALATLAYDPRRAGMFREELFAALRIIDSGDVAPDAMRGSWAGAIGQPQFMPSSFLQYAQDFDKDGKRDIWTSLPDVFASIAYYLKTNGWEEGVRWGREVKVPKTFTPERREAVAPLRTRGCQAVREMTVALPLTRWRELGLRTMSGAPVAASTIEASLVPAGTRNFLVYPNYDALLDYNCAHAYGLAVGLLADRIN
jgi:membrane-bound lytic murein transglycosylase B